MPAFFKPFYFLPMKKEGNVMSYFIKTSLGVEFEQELCEVCRETFHNMGDVKGFQSVNGTKADLEQGTDCYIWGVPVDFTYNFEGKDHTEELPESIITREATFRFGVRTGNSHNGYTQFDTPVLVIGIDETDSFVRMFLGNIVEAFKNKLMDIINLGQDQYWEYLDAKGLA
jgi:hypothetical protein